MANYYVRSDGSDSNNGLSHATAWATADKVRNTTFATGDRAYFRCGDTFYPSNTIYIWDGSEETPSILGAYYLDNNVEIHGVSGNRPILHGNGYTVPSNAYIGSVESWRGLVQANSKTYFIIQDLHIIESGCYSVLVQGASNLSTYCSNFIIRGIKSEGAWRSNIIVSKNKLGPGVIEDCELSYGGYGFTFSGGYGGYTHWPGGLSIANSPYANLVIRDNLLYNIWGEAVMVWCNPISLHLNSGYVDVYDNIFFNNYAAGIYFCAVNNCKAYRNLILGAGTGVTDNRFFRYSAGGRGWNGNGLWISAEILSGDATLFSTEVNDIDIYNNLVAGCYGGYRIASEFNSGARTMENINLYHNHFVGNYYGLTIASSINGYTTTDCNVRNNIWWKPIDCLGSDGSELSWHAARFNWSHNAWTAAKTYWSSANDITFNEFITKTAGWQSLTSIISATNFKKLSGCNAIRSGVKI